MMKQLLREQKQGLMNILKPIIWLVATLVIAGIVFTAVEQRRSSTAKYVEFNIASLENGSNLITKDDILLSIERSFGYKLEGLPISELNVERVERVLEGDPFISDANVYLDAQNVIHISVAQREPLLRVIDKHGANYYLDEAGMKMPLSKHFAARVLVATGNIPPYTADFLEANHKGLLSNIYDLSGYLMKDDFLHKQIEQIYVNSLGEVTLVPKVGNQKIQLGACKDFDDKLERLKTFYKDGIPYMGWHKYKTIDLRYKNQVVCKKKGKHNSSKINV